MDDPNLAVNYGYFNQLLKICITEKYHVFLDVISAKIGRKLMEKKLQELQVYAVNCPGKGQVVLNYDSVCVVARFLSDDDLLRLILAFHIDEDDDK